MPAGLVFLGVGNGRQPRFRVGGAGRLLRQRLQDADSVVEPSRGDVVVRQLKGRLGDAGGGDRLEMRFGLRGPIGADVEDGQRSVGQDVLGVHIQRALQRRLRSFGVRRGPLEIGQGQPGFDGARIDFNGLQESGLGQVPIALGHAQGSQVAIGQPATGLQFDGALDLAHGAVQVLQARERVAQNELRLHVGGIAIDDREDPRARVLELSCQHQERCGLDLGVVVLGQQVGRSYVLSKRGGGIATGRVGLGQLQARLTVLGVLLDGVPELDDRLLEFLFRHEALSVLEERLFGLFGVATRTDQDACQRGHHDPPGPSRPDHLEYLLPGVCL